MMRDVPAHYIRSNEQARIPARYVILDTESLRERNKRGEVQSWALAVATFLEWTKSGELRQSTTRYETPLELWSAVSDFTKVGRRTVLYAHNLNYDLRITKPPLPAAAEREELCARCEADVAILAAAIVAYVNWLRTGQGGNWKMA